MSDDERTTETESDRRSRSNGDVGGDATHPSKATTNGDGDGEERRARDGKEHSDPDSNPDPDAHPFPDGTVDLLRRYVEEEHGFLSWLDTRVDDVERGRLVMSVPYDEKLTNTVSPPTIHGGVAATLLDTTGGIAQRTVFEEPLAGGVATINLNVNYLRRASGDLIATADVVRAGTTVGWSAVTVESTPPDDPEADELVPVATGQAAYRLFDG
jgi:uncharacterized protein (TIGR00369 family)